MAESSLRILTRAHLFYKFALRQKMLYPLCRVHNLPLKIVPPELLVDVKKSESLWNRNKNGANNHSLVKHLNKCFSQNGELINYAVDLLKCISNRSYSSNFVFTIIRTLDDYTQVHEIEFSPTFNQKTEALRSVLPLKNYELVKIICSVFKIRDQASNFKEVIENMVVEQKLAEAAFCISALKMQQEFDLEKVLLPLLLEGKIYTASIYLNNHPDLQLRAAKLLDRHLTKDISLTMPYIDRKKLFKVLTNVVNMYKIPLINCPNLHMFRSKGAINILISRRIEQSVSEETWESMIKSVVGDNSYLQKFLVLKLVKKNDMKTALKMAEAYNINDQSLFLSSSKDSSTESENDSEDVKPEDIDIADTDVNCFEHELQPSTHLEFSLNFENITIISDRQTFTNSVNIISQNYSMIGIDSEWKPHFGLSRDRLSLIQLAGHDKVFIFDILSLTECLNPSDWDLLFDHVFGNPNLIKLGCGIVADINMILESIKGSAGKTVKFSHMLDMALFYQKLQEVYPDKLKDSPQDNNLKSLSFLCETFLGKPLNKEERLCDWEQRPLKESQLAYAALDAHCLLQLYDKLREDSLKVNINFDHFAKVAIVLTNKQWKPKKRFKGTKSDKGFQVHSVLPVEHFKVAIDPVFESQGRELRKLGADVIILCPDHLAESAIKLSKSEGRLIICADTLFNQIKDKIGEGLVHHFQSTFENPVSVTHFLQHFNVQVSAKNIFTRCMICNSSSGMKVNCDDLKKLVLLQKDNAASMNISVSNNLPSFSLDFQTFSSDLLASNINIKFASPVQAVVLNKCAFLCKNCGSIS